MGVVAALKDTDFVVQRNAFATLGNLEDENLLSNEHKAAFNTSIQAVVNKLDSNTAGTSVVVLTQLRDAGHLNRPQTRALNDARSRMAA